MSLKIFIILAVLVAIACLILLFWSFKIEPNLLEIKDYKLNNDKLAGLKIVYATDFHIAKSDTKRLNRIIEAINSQKADLILLGGDFIDLFENVYFFNYCACCLFCCYDNKKGWK